MKRIEFDPKLESGTQIENDKMFVWVEMETETKIGSVDWQQGMEMGMGLDRALLERLLLVFDCR